VNDPITKFAKDPSGEAEIRDLALNPPATIPPSQLRHKPEDYHFAVTSRYTAPATLDSCQSKASSPERAPQNLQTSSQETMTKREQAPGAAGASSTDRYAQWENLGTRPLNLISTNAGIYGKRITAGSTDKIVKWPLTDGASKWLEFGVPTTRTGFSPTSTIQDPTGIAVFWAGDNPSDATKGLYSQSGSPETDDIGIRVAVADNGSSGNQWVITRAGSVWKRSARGGGTNAKLAFELIKDTEIRNLGELAAVSDGKGFLYAASGTTLAKVGQGGELVKWDLPERVTTLIYAFNELWIGAGAIVYRLNGNDFVPYTDMSLNAGRISNLGNAPAFCISNGNLYGSNGMVYPNIGNSKGAPRPVSYLNSTDKPDYSSLLAFAVTSGSFVGGVYCSDNPKKIVFTALIDSQNPSAGLQLIKIQPLF
jgi:hypothetical protein